MVGGGCDGKRIYHNQKWDIFFYSNVRGGGGMMMMVMVKFFYAGRNIRTVHLYYCCSACEE